MKVFISPYEYQLTEKFYFDIKVVREEWKNRILDKLLFVIYMIEVKT